jgi:drug/metabolite transporter (DMT)-like permease
MAVLLALAGALANALTSILQRSAAESAPSEMSFTWRLLSYVVRRPAWIAGMATMVAGFVLQALALRFSPF